MRLINTVSTIFETASRLDNGIHFWRVLPSKKYTKFVAACETFKTIALKYIHASLEAIREKRRLSGAAVGDDDNPTLLEMFAARGCDEATTVTMALDMMFAGVDTTSHALSFAMYHLARNPEVQERLHAEVLMHLPTKTSKLDKKTFDHMPYMKVKASVHVV